MVVRATDPVLSFHDGVVDLCVSRLREALNPKTHLFDRQLREKRWDSTLGTEDLTSTAICLVGLHRAGIEPTRLGLDVQRTLSALAVCARQHDYPGGLGLVLWANAVWQGFPLAELLERVGVGTVPPNDLVVRLTTMETAWLVSGLMHEQRRSQDPGARSLLSAARAELATRYEPSTGLFRHAGDQGLFGDRVRKWVPNFADQIYSVQAMSFLALAEQDAHALEMAEGSARRLVELQGSLGQWWWHYDPRDGRVAQPFPVYSVHQHAMAPMALMSLAAAGGTDHRGPIEVSHAWIAHNELGVDLLDREAGTIWRDIEPAEGGLGRTLRHARSVLGWKSENGGGAPRNLKINYETRPYEWAWCLFAGAIAAGMERPEHVV